MEYCLLQGKSISPEMPSPCNTCKEYLLSCMPIIDTGAWVCGECMEVSYCEWCSFIKDCNAYC